MPGRPAIRTTPISNDGKRGNRNGAGSAAPFETAKTPKAIIFDIGRVLIPIHSGGGKFVRLMRMIGVEPEAAFHVFWREPEIESHMRGRIDSREFYRQSRERFRLSLGFAAFVEAWCDIFLPDPAMANLFNRLAESGRFRLGLLSDTDPLHWDWLRRSFPWLDRAERPTLSHLTGFLKPEPGAFRQAAADCGQEQLEDCLFIDDLPANVQAARSLGMAALLFTGAGKLVFDLTEMGLWNGGNCLEAPSS
jgi:putative hydrolase of the HAD superfamily